MLPLTVPDHLANPVVVSGRVVSKVMMDLTSYLSGPSEKELDRLIDLFETICPSDRLVKYKIPELQFWAPISQPILTASGRVAAARGIKRPYLEPVRQRIRDGRAFEILFWDGRSISDPSGSWSFSCRRIHLRSSGLYAFVRFIIPLRADHAILQEAARVILDSVEVFSGHGGLAFLYDPLMLGDAFDAIYAQARRFWAIDVEYLNGTLPLMKSAIKGVNWITLLGHQLSSEESAPEIEAVLRRLAETPDVVIERGQFGNVITAGPAPVVGDQNRPDQSLDLYFTIASALEPLFLADHPDFPGERFRHNENTIGWMRRFIEPSGWR